MPSEYIGPPAVYPYTPTSFHKELFDAHGPIEQGGDWFIFCGAVASMFDQIVTYAEDQPDGTPGWGILLDVDRCPVECLPWLGQFVGVVVPPTLSEADQREWIRNTDGFKRGTPAAMAGAAAHLLTGTQTVYFNERAGDAYHITVATLVSETTDSAAVLTALMAAKPAGLILTYSTVTGNDYNTLTFTHSDYNQVKARYATYAAVLANPMA